MLYVTFIFDCHLLFLNHIQNTCRARDTDKSLCHRYGPYCIQILGLVPFVLSFKRDKLQFHVCRRHARLRETPYLAPTMHVHALQFSLVYVHDLYRIDGIFSSNQAAGKLSFLVCVLTQHCFHCIGIGACPSSIFFLVVHVVPS